MAFRRRLMYSRRGRRRWRRCLMHYWRWRRSLLMGRRRWRWRVHIVLGLPLRSRGERLRRRIGLPFSLCRRWRTVIIGAPYRLGRRLVIITPTIEVAPAISSVARGRLLHYFWIAIAVSSSAFIGRVRLWL